MRKLTWVHTQEMCIRDRGVAVFILISGWGLVMDTLSPLLGESPSEDLEMCIRDSAYIVLMLMVPKDWKQLKVTYVPTFLEGKSLTFVMNASDVIRS